MSHPHIHIKPCWTDWSNILFVSSTPLHLPIDFQLFNSARVLDLLSVDIFMLINRCMHSHLLLPCYTKLFYYDHCLYISSFYATFNKHHQFFYHFRWVFPVIFWILSRIHSFHLATPKSLLYKVQQCNSSFWYQEVAIHDLLLFFFPKLETCWCCRCHGHRDQHTTHSQLP